MTAESAQGEPEDCWGGATQGRGVGEGTDGIGDGQVFCKAMKALAFRNRAGERAWQMDAPCGL